MWRSGFAYMAAKSWLWFDYHNLRHSWQHRDGRWHFPQAISHGDGLNDSSAGFSLEERLKGEGLHMEVFVSHHVPGQKAHQGLHPLPSCLILKTGLSGPLLKEQGNSLGVA